MEAAQEKSALEITKEENIDKKIIAIRKFLLFIGNNESLNYNSEYLLLKNQLEKLFEDKKDLKKDYLSALKCDTGTRYRKPLSLVELAEAETEIDENYEDHHLTTIRTTTNLLNKYPSLKIFFEENYAQLEKLNKQWVEFSKNVDPSYGKISVSEYKGALGQ